MKSTAALLAASLFALAACGGSGSPESNAADQLRDAAEQSTPEAANVLENGAERIEEQGVAGNGAQDVQNVLQDAGKAQMLNQSGNAQR